VLTHDDMIETLAANRADEPCFSAAFTGCQAFTPPSRTLLGQEELARSLRRSPRLATMTRFGRGHAKREVDAAVRRHAVNDGAA
jgi:hypothetical protein